MEINTPQAVVIFHGTMVENLSRISHMAKELELEEDMAHHRRGWVIKRIGWVFLFALIFLSLIGYTGGGRSSERTITEGDISVTYERYSRQASVVPFTVKLKNVTTDTFYLCFEDNYMQEIKLDEVIPTPLKVLQSGNSISYYFLKDNKGDHSEVCFYLKPLKNGTYQFGLSSGNTRIKLEQLILP